MDSHPFTHLGYRLELLTAQGIGFVGCHFRSFCSVTPGQNLHGLTDNDHRLPEPGLWMVFGYGQICGGQGRLGIFFKTAVAFGEQQFFIGRCNLARPAFIFEISIDNPGLVRNGKCFSGHPGPPMLADGFSPPIGLDFFNKQSFLLFCDQIGVLGSGGNRVQFVPQPVVRQFRTNAGGSGAVPGVTDDQLVVLNVDCLGFTMTLDGLGPADDDGFAFRLLEHLCTAFGALQTYGGFVREILFFEQFRPVGNPEDLILLIHDVSPIFQF